MRIKMSLVLKSETYNVSLVVGIDILGNNSKSAADDDI